MINNVTDIDRSSDLGTRARRAAARLVTALARLGRDTRGATMVEYAVLVGLLSAGAITLIVATGDTMSKPWSTLADTLPGVSDGTEPGDTAAADGPAATDDETSDGPGDDTSVADGGTGGDSSPSGGGQGGDSGEIDVAVATGGGASSGGGGGSATSGGGGVASGGGGTGSTGGSSGGGQSGGSAATSGGGQSSGSAATSGGGGGSAGTGGGGSAGSAGLAGGYVAPGGGEGAGAGGGSRGGTGTTMAEANPAPYGAAETETGTMQASLVWRAKSLGTALLAEGASGEMGAALLAVGGQGAGSAVAVLEDMSQGKHPWLALLFVLTLIAAFYAIAKRTKSARFKKRMLTIADHRWD